MSNTNESLSDEDIEKLRFLKQGKSVKEYAARFNLTKEEATSEMMRLTGLGSFFPLADVPDEFWKITHSSADNEEGIDLYIDPGDASVETLQEVFAALNELNIANGGLGLQFKTDGMSVHVMEGAEV